jgi:hypothetical protein
VVGLGIATQYVPARTAMLAFVVIAALAVVLCSRSVSARHIRSKPGTPPQ